MLRTFKVKYSLNPNKPYTFTEQVQAVNEYEARKKITKQFNRKGLTIQIISVERGE
ncbi:hypothetical protein [Staphylococcus pasteuri]|uniref:hypothetical protein n=1 Tax=Staphylococcus pasteuri TaxID=45972 RepID=UPI001639D91C|nr:hypothetical protein [Staphylococcus pasteuri]MEB6612106.1 hypothetical protein [Staphylococcus pasteuri]